MRSARTFRARLRALRANALDASIRRIPERTLRVLVPLTCALVVTVASLLAPLRTQGGDTVPGRLGAAALVCHRTLDLRTIDWIAATSRSALPYWLVEGRDGRVISAFGPAAALLGAPALASLPSDRAVWDRELQRRTRWPAAIAVGLSAAFLAAAIRITRPEGRWSGVAALSAALSFAGAASLGQGLWQQTASLPFLMAGLLAIVAARRSRAALLLGPALLAFAVAIRPALSPIALGMGLSWLIQLRAAPRRARTLALATLLAALSVLPMLLCNWHLLGHMLPVSQYASGGRLFQRFEGPVFALTPRRTVPALAGLLFSPARGIFWFAPIVPLSAFVAWKDGADSLVRRLILSAIGMQFALAASYCWWWGGWSFGPRFVVESVWLAAYLLATAAPSPRWPTKLAMAMTVMVGLLGLARYDLGWDYRHDPDAHPGELWSVTDGPLVELVTKPPVRLKDAPRGPYAFCNGADTLSTLQPVK